MGFLWFFFKTDLDFCVILEGKCPSCSQGNTIFFLRMTLLETWLLYFMVHIKISLTFKAPITTAADSILVFHCFSEKIRHDISCESSARQRIHMKHHSFFSSKDKKNMARQNIMMSAAILLGILRVKFKLMLVRDLGPFWMFCFLWMQYLISYFRNLMSTTPQN